MRVDPTNHPRYDLICAVSAAVLAAERDTDASIKTLSTLIGSTLDEFAAAELPAAMAQRSLDKLAEAIGAQIGSRRMLTEAHREYGRTAKALGVTMDDWGPWWPCPSGKTDDTAPAQPLRVVA